MKYKLCDSRNAKWAARNTQGVVTLEDWTDDASKAAELSASEFMALPPNPNDPEGIFVDVVPT